MKIRMDMKFKVGGREVSLSNFGRALQEEGLGLAERAVEQQLGRIRCPEHGQTAHVTSKRSLGRLEWEIRGCCNRLVEEVKKALA